MVEDSPEVLALFESHYKMVDVTVRQIIKEMGEVIEFDEMASYGREGLLIAARRFDPDRGISFARFASYRVRGAILDGMRSSSMLPRRAYEKLRALRAANSVAEGFMDEQTAALQLSIPPEELDRRLGEHLANLATSLSLGLEGEYGTDDASEPVRIADDPNPESAVGNRELMRIVSKRIDELPEREAILVRRHLLGEEPLDDICADIGVSRSWASRLLNRGLSRLNKMLTSELGPSPSFG